MVTRYNLGPFGQEQGLASSYFLIPLMGNSCAFSAVCLLALLVLPKNRKIRTWAVWIPWIALEGLALLIASILPDMPADVRHVCIDVLLLAASALAVLVLIAPCSDAFPGWIRFVLALISSWVFGAIFFLLKNQRAVFSQDVVFMLVYALIMLVLIVALGRAGHRCGDGWNTGCLLKYIFRWIELLGVLFGTVIGVAALILGTSEGWPIVAGFALLGAGLGLILVLLCLPFLLLGIYSEFFRARYEAILGMKARKPLEYLAIGPASVASKVDPEMD